MNDDQTPDTANVGDEAGQEGWVKPEIVSFKPIEAAEGISYRPRDGISNLTV